MIDPKSDSQEKLAQVRKLFQDAVDHFEECNGRRHFVSRFYHNSLGKGQWTDEDRQYLEDEGRPVLSFNVSRSKVQTAIGMHKEQMRRAVVVPVGAEDKLLADVLNAVAERVLAKTSAKVADSMALGYGYVKGEGDSAVEVENDPKRMGWISIHQRPASPHDVHWDPASRRPDRSDASYVTWDRWLSKSEFIQEYPEYVKAWDELEKGSSDATKWDGEDLSEGKWQAQDDYKTAYDSYYYDRVKRRARVVRFEYKLARKKRFARVNGQYVEMTDDEIDTLKRAESLGIFPTMEYDAAWETEIHAIDFCGIKILYDSMEEEDERAPNPFDGFSIVPYIWAQDDELGIPYGMMQNLIDPQMELNKAWSASLEHTVGQEQPGYLGEEGSVKDPKQFEDETQTRGSLAIVAKGALVSNAIQRREVPQPSTAAQQRLANSFDVFDRISGISADLERPAAVDEPATSVAIRYHKSQLSLTEARENYDEYLKAIYSRVVDAIMKSMPDDQIADLLSNNDKYLVQGGFVVELGDDSNNPGRRVPISQPVPLHQMRSKTRDIELDTTTENTTLRNLKVGSWVQAMQAGVPIPPDLLAESLTDSRSERERMKQYAEEQMRQQQIAAQREAMMQQQAAQQTQKTIEQTLGIEAAKVQQKAESDRTKAALQAQKQTSDAAIDLVGVLERADENEKRMLVEWAKAWEASQRQNMGGTVR